MSQDKKRVILNSEKLQTKFVKRHWDLSTKAWNQTTSTTTEIFIPSFWSPEHQLGFAFCALEKCFRFLYSRPRKGTHNDRKPPGVGGRGRGRGREDGTSGQPLKGIGRGLDDGGAKGTDGGRGRGGPGGRTGGSRGSGRGR